MSPALRVAVALLAIALSGCRAIHESVIRSNLTATRFTHLRFPFAEVRARLAAVSHREGERAVWLSVDEATADGWRWCLSELSEHGCYRAHVVDGEAVFTLEDPEAADLLRVFWTMLDPVGSQRAANPDDDDVPRLAVEEEERFVPKWSFVAGARSGVVSAFSDAVFTFGGQLGVRYWASTYLVPGLALELENTVFRDGTEVTLAPQARLELSVWRPENARFFNLPNLSFLMAAEPLFALGSRVTVGGRAVVGVHLAHVGRYPTPFFFEFGFQSLTVRTHDASGLRVAIGIGF